LKIEKIISISFFVAIISLHGIQLIISISPPSLTHEGSVSDVYVKDDIAYFADRDHGLVIMDVSNPSEPFELGRLDEGKGSQIYVHSNLAYLIGNSKLKIIDIANPSSPNNISEFDASGSSISGMYVDFPLFYLEGGYGNFWIYNLSNPLSPSQLGHIDLDDSIYDFCVSNDIAYVTYRNGLKTIDVSNSSNPTELGQFGDDYYYGCVVEGNIAYVTGWPGYIDIIDVSDPSNPTKLSQFDEDESSILSSARSGIAFLDDTLYVIDHNDGLELIDVSDPLKPFKYAQFHMSEDAINIYIDFPNAYLICDEGGFLILDISNPSNWINISSILNFVITIVSIGVIVSLILLKLRIQKKKV